MADMNTRAAQKRAEANVERDKAFQAFIARPEIKLIMSLIPPNEAAPEALQGLLQAAYAEGFDRGAAYVVSDLTRVAIGSIGKRTGGD